MKASLRFDGSGHVACLYTEAVDLRALGRLQVVRATDIRFCESTQQWEVRCAATGQLLHTDPSRNACLQWEQDHLPSGPNHRPQYSIINTQYPIP